MVASAIYTIHETRSRIVDTAWRTGAGPGRVVGNRLGGVSLHTHITRETARKFRICIEVESVPLVAVGWGVFSRQVIEIGIAEGEGIALV